MTIRWPYSRPNVSETDALAAGAVLTEQFLTEGPQLAAFEAAFGELLCGVDAAVCSSGTAALHLAYIAAGLGPGAGLLTTPLTFLATANAARFCGAPVVFADVDPVTGNLSPDAVRRGLKETTVPIRAITAVHLAGRPCDLIALREIADEHGCLLVEDACHAIGARYGDDNGVGYSAGGCAHADLATFSFHAIKHIAMGEGGAVAARDPALMERIRLLRSHGIQRAPDSWQSPPEPDAPWYYEMHQLGFNYRLTEAQCALGLSQLDHLADDNNRRNAIARLYRARLSDCPHIDVPAPVQWVDGHAWHLFPIAIDFKALGKSRGNVMRALADRGVGTQVHYIPLYHQPYYAGVVDAPLPGAEAYYARTLSIPMYPQLTDGEVTEIAGLIREVVAG